MSRYAVYHWEGKHLSIPGAFQEGDAAKPGASLPYWLEIPDDQFGSKIKELAEQFDLMILGPRPERPFFAINFDAKGRRFKTR